MSDISHSIENMSLDMEEAGFLNKENRTPVNSPTKSILHDSPNRSPHLYYGNEDNGELGNGYANYQGKEKVVEDNGILGGASGYGRKHSSDIACNPRTKRLASVTQLFFLDYYCEMFDYVISRRDRTNTVKKSLIYDPNFCHDGQRQQFEWKNYIGRERAFLRKRRLKPKHKDFQMITQVGQGGYGQVFLARKKDTREICALKILNKKLLVKLDETKHVLTERDILTNARSEWLTKLLYAFQDPTKVYLAMEFIPGGDFRTLLNNTGYLIPPHARFYISEMFMSVNSLHELGFIHRDLKPENFLIDSKGHIKLTDFGLAAGTVSNERIESMRIRLRNLQDLDHYQVPSKVMNERQRIFKESQDQHNLANSIVGSPDYMALEVLEGKNYDYTIDYWSLGCMLFESLCGYPPFSGSRQQETYYNLKNWRTALRRPQTRDGRYVFSDRTWHLITRLITSPNNRLRNLRQVQSMSYFNDISNWDKLRERIPPFTPQLDNEEDAGYFDDFDDEESMQKYKNVFARQEQNEQLLDKLMPARKINNNFIGFTYKHKLNPNNKFQAGEAGILSNNNSFPSRQRLDPLATLY